MNVKAFVDSNILIYAYDMTANGKHTKALDLLQMLWKTRLGVLSVQVLQEVFVNVTRKIPKPLPVATARNLVKDYRLWVVAPTGTETVLHAIDVQTRFGFSFWDSLIVSSALETKCEQLYSEDLQHGQIIEGRLLVVNPFITAL
jgi:predicted nucleic acid-binding protein